MGALRDINLLKKNAKVACEMFLAECRKRGLPVLVTETLRTKERQNELYAQGRTKPGNIVTWTKNSRHMTGLAWDICKNKKGEEYSDLNFFEKCGEVAKELGITWGGTWKNKDMPHFEVTDDWEAYDMKEFEDIKKELELVKNELAKVKNAKVVYRYTLDVPVWARATIQKLLDKGYYKGLADDDLNLSEDVMRTLVILDRAGLFE
ncbi:MAG: M15 family metallopeptidase [Ruminococcaceae bacterium]|nr:M15 family metallopeptidase [Oscillospiraceae bacterium]